MIKKIPIQPEDLIAADIDTTRKRKYAKVRTVEHEYDIGRWALVQLIRKGLIRGHLVKPSPHGRGFRVIELASLDEYLSKH